jgi:formamidopyrimidine-DNA glycosylase
LSGSARLRNSAGSVDTAGVISAVTTKSPACSLAWRWVAIYDRSLPELPDLTVYLESLESRIANRRLLRVVPLNPFFLRTAVPPLASAGGRRVQGLRRLGKRIVIELEGELYLVFHLMIAGRLRWYDKPDGKPPKRIALALLEFESGSLAVTEAGTKRRASVHLVQGKAALEAMDPGGIEIFSSSPQDFRRALLSENHTLKRALTDPHLFAGIGNAYSDEILHRARLSPIAMTKSLSEAEVERLHAATREVLREWVERLRAQTGAGFPEKVTAFREEMAVHGRYGKPCPVCGAPVQRIVYAENETNYCARCQTGGRILADRALSRLLKKSWPRSIDELG